MRARWPAGGALGMSYRSRATGNCLLKL
jgi:hypothetical protein